MWYPQLFALVLAFGQESDPAPVIEGTWGGWVEILGTELWMQVRADGERLWLDDFAAGPPTVEAADVERNGDEVRFLYEAGIGPTEFAGRVSARSWTGRVACAGSEPGSFRFVRFHDSANDRVLGRYSDERDRPVWVVPRTFGGVRLVRLSDSGNGFSGFAMDAWLPFDSESFLPATSDTPWEPARTLSDAEGNLHISGDAPQTASRTSGEVRRVAFSSGDVVLEGWLLLPPGPGPHPAIVFGHGSGYVSADSPFSLYTCVRLVEEFGLAVLRWDKRGVGRSTGDQRLATYRDLAADLAAGHRWLRSQPGIDPARVGLGGVSQAPSWPIPLVAATEPAVAFVIATSGSVMTATETNTFNWSNRLREQGFSEEQVADAAAFFRSSLALVGATGPDAQARYDEHLAQFEETPWFEPACDLGGLRTPLTDPIAARWRLIWDLDPVDSWKDVHCPVYQSWGADDRLVDARACSARMQALVEQTGQENFTSIVYPSPAGHAGGSLRAPSYFDDLRAWFEREVQPPQ